MIVIVAMGVAAFARLFTVVCGLGTAGEGQHRKPCHDHCPTESLVAHGAIPLFAVTCIWLLVYPGIVSAGLARGNTVGKTPIQAVVADYVGCSEAAWFTRRWCWLFYG
jgi:hypothetical protein